MTSEDRLVIERIRAAVERHRQLAELHESIGELQKAEECRVLALFLGERARKLELRLSVA